MTASKWRSTNILHTCQNYTETVRTVESRDSIEIESENIPYCVQTFLIELAGELHFDFKNFHNGCFKSDKGP